MLENDKVCGEETCTYVAPVPEDNGDVLENGRQVAGSVHKNTSNASFVRNRLMKCSHRFPSNAKNQS